MDLGIRELGFGKNRKEMIEFPLESLTEVLRGLGECYVFYFPYVLSSSSEKSVTAMKKALEKHRAVN